MEPESLSDDDLRSLIEKCSAEWTRRLRADPKMLRAQFPYGQIRRLDSIQQRWPYLDPADARKIASTIQLCDVNSFFLNTWKISLTAGAEWEWQATLPVVAVMEALLYSYGTRIGKVRSGTQFKKCINKFRNDKVISEHLHDELHIHRNRRNDIHLFLKARVGLHDEKPARYNQAVRSLRKLERALHNHWSAQCP